MQYFGYFLLVVFVAGIIGGLLQRAKGQALLAAPFKRTGEAASNPQAGDAKGTVSVEGQVACQQPLMGPQSGQPCIYFHYKLEEEFEKSTLTEQGTKTTKEWKIINEQKTGTAFTIDDGSGPVWVQITDSVDADLTQSFSGMPGTGGAGSATQAAAGMLAAAVTGGTRLRATERILHAQGKLFALGKLDQGRIVKTDGMMGKLILSPKGRDGLLGATKRNAIIAFVVGGVSLVAGLPMAIFGSPPVTDECPSAGLADTTTKACRGHIFDDSGLTLTWKVSKDGDYVVNVTQPNVKYPIWPRLTLVGPDGTPVGQAKGLGKGENANLPEHLAAGTYKINVRDDVNGYAAPFKNGGGLSFWIDIEKAQAATVAPSASTVAETMPSSTSTAMAAAGTTSTAKAGTGGATPHPGSKPAGAGGAPPPPPPPKKK
jgi:hypothetical protein